MATSFPSPEELKGTVLGTLLYVGVYAGILIPFQSFSKFYLFAQKKKEAKTKAAKDGESFQKKPGSGSFFLATKYYNSQDMLALCGDRSVGNYLEQSLVFLPLYWLHALFVENGASESLMIASIYSISRGIYPPLFWFAFGTSYTPLIGISTGPGYIITFYLLYQVAAKFAFA
ncbi:expressed unknown protein [Seminavis robusta]|uniref:Uncharacterized protein n=1 Tax=Seminavis robusta TaxID=568900 RepID=A0A9N8ESK8_9STRA|nr:expressed unknown protein [Seminavis robusta]|eukprot:Sro1758_g295730.1 n/a (173) ;mRNA; r:9464-10073